jgi:hypothetical protein
MCSYSMCFTLFPDIFFIHKHCTIFLIIVRKYFLKCFTSVFLVIFNIVSHIISQNIGWNYCSSCFCIFTIIFHIIALNVYHLIERKCFTFYFMIYWLIFHIVLHVCFKKYFDLCFYGYFTMFHTVLVNLFYGNIEYFVSDIFDDVSQYITGCFSWNKSCYISQHISHCFSIFFIVPHSSCQSELARFQLEVPCRESESVTGNPEGRTGPCSKSFPK